MKSAPAEIHRVKDYDEIKPLIALCKSGKLFEIQDWIATAKPVNAPPPPAKGRRGKTPLEVAIEAGFHSLIQVLLLGGAVIEPEGWDSPMNRALKMRRLDIVKLLVEHGFNPKSVDMERVFDSWDPEIMTYFIEKGADIETGKPLAYALCNRIRTALGLLKRYRQRFPFLEEQANIALRHHCKEGNMKWISLMLWAGADPYEPGHDTYTDELDDDHEGLSALGYAALYDHCEVFQMRQVRLDPMDARVSEIVGYLCEGKAVNVLKTLLEKGLEPNDQKNGGCSAIQHCLEHMGWRTNLHTRYSTFKCEYFDNSETLENIKAIHLLARHGAKWLPTDRNEVNSARRSLLKLKPDYTVEFVWIMSKYRASTPECIQHLLSTPRIKSHTSAYKERLDELSSSWPCATIDDR